ncbi:HNH endonuclease signature motif containing protein [Nocardioides koreensis]|uniref:HNH endonuclease signature motif containing protein n=1 Tax=Nocardioides koreensis TaxID=433651 RepID=A0ABN3A804_9ACTN
MAVDPLPLKHPLLGDVHAVLQQVEQAAQHDPAYLNTAEKRAALLVVTGAVEQLRAVQLRLLANADDVAVDTGARNVAAWAELAMRVDSRETARAARLGEALDRRWPRLAAAFLDGRATEAQATVLVRALDALPERLGPALLGRAEEYLVEQTAEFAPRELKVLGESVLEKLAPEIAEEEERKKLESEERAARRATSLSMHARGDGATDIRIRVPEHVAARLKVYLESFTSPRQPGRPDPADEQARLPYPRRLGEAFCALLERLPAKVLPQHGGTATSVMVTIPFDQLTSGLGAADLGSGDRITAAEARRLACTADILPVVLGGKGEVLDLGRARRLFSPGQRKAMAVRDRRCRTEGCSIPAAWCEAHHLRPWSQGGRTDFDDGVLLCPWHHHRAHDERFDMSRLASGDVRFTRRT